MKKILMTSLVFVGLSATTVYAHGSATGVVKERMEMMGEMKGATKTLASMMRGDKEYSSEIVKSAAKTIQDNAGEHMVKYFPEGSIDEPSEAKPEIWENWPEFQRIAHNLSRFAEGLGEAASNDLMMNTQMHGTNVESSMNSNMMSQNTMTQNTMTQNTMTMGMTEKPMDNQDFANMRFDSMAPDGIFKMMTQTCSECHTKFRLDK